MQSDPNLHDIFTSSHELTCCFYAIEFNMIELWLTKKSQVLTDVQSVWESRWDWPLMQLLLASTVNIGFLCYCWESHYIYGNTHSHKYTKSYRMTFTTEQFYPSYLNLIESKNSQLGASNDAHLFSLSLSRWSALTSQTHSRNTDITAGLKPCNTMHFLFLLSGNKIRSKPSIWLYKTLKGF